MANLSDMTEAEAFDRLKRELVLAFAGMGITIGDVRREDDSVFVIIGHCEWESVAGSEGFRFHRTDGKEGLIAFEDFTDAWFMSVWEYFQARAGETADGGGGGGQSERSRMEAWHDVALDSACGKDCKRLIDKGREMARIADSSLAHAIWSAVASGCDVFIYG